MENQIILTKESSESDIRRYFEGVLQLSKSNKEYPVNLDEVWPLVYVRKDVAVGALKKTFVEGIDYIAKPVENQSLHISTERNHGGQNKVDYYLTTSCLEYFIARKVRHVFEVYRQVFHRTAQIIGALQQQFQVPQSFSDALLLAAQQQKQIEEQQKMIEVKVEENKEQAVVIEQQGQTIVQQEEEIKKAAPKVKYYEDVLSSNNLLTTTQIAKDLGMSADKLNRRLADSDIQYKQSGTWILKRPYYSWNLGRIVSTPYIKSDGSQGSKELWKWNQRGKLFIVALNKCEYNAKKAVRLIQGEEIQAVSSL